MPEHVTNPHSPLSPAMFHILLALATGERHGYDIMKQAALDSSNQVKLGPGSLYGTIKQLITAKAIEESDERPDPAMDDQRRRYYRLTPAGRQLLGLELERFEQAVHLGHARRLLPNHKLGTDGARYA